MTTRREFSESVYVDPKFPIRKAIFVISSGAQCSRTYLNKKSKTRDHHSMKAYTQKV